MKTRKLGTWQVGSIGLGGMWMSIEGRPDESQSIAAIHAALDAGVTLLDTADAYHRDGNEVGHNESLFAKALSQWGGDSSSILVATKGGHLRPGDGSWTQNGDPDYLKRAAKESAKRLGVESIGLYQFHRPDPTVAYADSVGALRDLLDDGTIQMAGISNASVEQITLAQEILGGRLVSVQNQFSPAYRGTEDTLELCASLDIAFLPWRPLGGIAGPDAMDGQFEAFNTIAATHEVSPAVVCLAWHLAKAPVVIPIPGATRAASILDSVQAADVTLTAEELAVLDAA